MKNLNRRMLELLQLSLHFIPYINMQVCSAVAENLQEITCSDLACDTMYMKLPAQLMMFQQFCFSTEIEH